MGSRQILEWGSIYPIHLIHAGGEEGNMGKPEFVVVKDFLTDFGCEE